jgi:hypothetical protein
MFLFFYIFIPVFSKLDSGFAVNLASRAIVNNTIGLASFCQFVLTLRTLPGKTERIQMDRTQKQHQRPHAAPWGCDIKERLPIPAPT